MNNKSTLQSLICISQNGESSMLVLTHSRGSKAVPSLPSSNFGIDNKVDLFKQMARIVGASSSEIKEALEALAKPHIIYATPQERENEEIQALAKVFVDRIKGRSKAVP